MLRLSLVIATYNRSGQLLGTLRSVAAQDAPFADWECVVVNNNSSDDTVERAEAFAAEHPDLRMRVVTERHQGLSWARNRGIRESRGEVIAIIDDDERIAPEFVSAYLAFFGARPDAMVAGGPIVPEYPQGRPRWMSHFTERPIANPLDLGGRVRRFPAHRIPGGGNMALRRTIFDRYGMFDTRLGRRGAQLIGGEETELFGRLSQAGVAFYYVPGAVMYHIIPPEKLTDDYFDRLNYNIGVGQRLRAELRGDAVGLRIRELFKWGVAAAMACIWYLSGRCAQARYLLRQRRRISSGIRRGSNGQCS